MLRNTQREDEIVRVSQENFRLRQQIQAKEKELRDLNDCLRSKEIIVKELENMIGQLRFEIDAITRKHDSQITELNTRLMHLKESHQNERRDRK